jgi:hypothetical protein
MILKLTIKDALIHSDLYEWDEAPLLSQLLIGIPQCRDVVTVLLLLSYSDIAVIYVAGLRVIGFCNAVCFKVFVDYPSDSGNLITIH